MRLKQTQKTNKAKKGNQLKTNRKKQIIQEEIQNQEDLAIEKFESKKVKCKKKKREEFKVEAEKLTKSNESNSKIQKKHQQSKLFFNKNKKIYQQNKPKYIVSIQEVKQQDLGNQLIKLKGSIQTQSIKIQITKNVVYQQKQCKGQQKNKQKRKYKHEQKQKQRKDQQKQKIDEQQQQNPFDDNDNSNEINIQYHLNHPLLSQSKQYPPTTKQKQSKTSHLSRISSHQLTQKYLLQQLHKICKLIQKNLSTFTLLNSSKIWSIDSYQNKKILSNQQYQKILVHITSSKIVEQLRLHFDYFKSFNSSKSNSLSSFLMFSHIKFQKLIRIQINNVIIESLQPFVWMQCQNLKFLKIQKTNITNNIRFINKLYLNNLSYLRIVNNPISYMKLNRIKIKKGSNLDIIYSIQPYQFRNYSTIEESISIQNLSQLAKSQVTWSTFTRNCRFAKNRISQPKIILKMNTLSRIKWEDFDNSDSSDSY